MKRARYFDNMLVSEAQLNWGEQTKEEGILERWRVIIQRGVVGGLRLSGVGSSDLTISPGIGFTAGGEEIFVGEGQIYHFTGGDGVRYVYLKYVLKERAGSEAPLYGGGSSPATILEDSFEVVVSENPPSSEPEMESKILIGIVTISDGVIRSIVDASNDVLSVKLAISQPVLITGVRVVGQGASLQKGWGVLKLRRIDEGSYGLSWKAPGRAAFGAEEIIQFDCERVLQADVADMFIAVSVVFASLPPLSVGEERQENILVYDVYDRFSRGFVDRFSAVDDLHRRMVGTGVVSEQNPHGLSIADIGGAVETLASHGFYMHSTGIWKGSDPHFLEVVKETAKVLRIRSDLYGLYFVAGFELRTTNQTLVDLSDLDSENAFLVLQIYVDRGGTVKRSIRMRYGNVRQISGITVVDICDFMSVGNHVLHYHYVNTDEKYLWLDNGEQVNVAGLGDGDYFLRNERGEWVLFRLKGSELLNTDREDTLVISQSVDTEENLVLANVSYDAQDTMSILAIRDRRLFGTLGMEAIRDDVLQRGTNQFVASYVEELLGRVFSSGVLEGLSAKASSDRTKLIIGAGKVLIKGRMIDVGYTEFDVFGQGRANTKLWFYVDERGGIGYRDHSDGIRFYHFEYGNDAGRLESGNRLCFFAMVQTDSTGKIASVVDMRAKPGVDARGLGALVSLVPHGLCHKEVVRTAEGDIQEWFFLNLQPGSVEVTFGGGMGVSAKKIYYNLLSLAVRMCVSSGASLVDVFVENAGEAAYPSVVLRKGITIGTEGLAVYNCTNGKMRLGIDARQGGAIHLYDWDGNLRFWVGTSGVGVRDSDGSDRIVVSDNGSVTISGQNGNKKLEINDSAIVMYDSDGTTERFRINNGSSMGLGRDGTGIYVSSDGSYLDIHQGPATNQRKRIRVNKNGAVEIFDSDGTKRLSILDNGDFEVYGQDGKKRLVLDQFAQWCFLKDDGTSGTIIYPGGGIGTGFLSVGGVTIISGSLDVGGDLTVYGDLDVYGSKNFVIEHPLDENKKLVHCAFEGPEPGLIYRGRGKLVNGVAEVELPAYFEYITKKENRDVFVTPRNGWSALKVSDVVDGKFRVELADANGNPEQEFSWLVIAERYDKYMQEHPFEVEKLKVKENK